jgi:integrase
MADCDTGVLHDYGLHVRGENRSRSRTHKILSAVTRLWAFDELSAYPAGIARPPWDELGVDDYLPAATSPGGGENTTEPVAAEALGPLLVWAMRMVDDFADDILAAWAETQRLKDAARSNPSTPAGQEALHAYLNPLIAGMAPLPVMRHLGRLTFARSYVGGMTGASDSQIQQFFRQNGLKAAAARRPGPCPLDIPVTGHISGAPWREALDFDEAADLMRHLGTAAFVVCAYLTGMRPGEVLGLRTGCCPAPEPDEHGNIGRHLIRGHEYKTSVDEHGNHQSAGTERDVPWVAITPVVNAIRVLERMVPDGYLLFDHNAHDLHKNRPGTGSLKPGSLNVRIEAFIAWANREAAGRRLGDQVIPPDPHGTIGTRRFRRSLAWHIARRPNGLVALAIQYGHLRSTLVSDGYASRSRGGIHELIDVETVLAVADTVAGLRDGLHAGEGISGPAARRVINAAARATVFAGTTINATSAQKLIANEDVMLYDNPAAFVLCHYKRAQALCHRDGMKDHPSLDHCVPGCGNIVRTDRHAAGLRARADVLDKRAAHAPQPVGDRLRGRAAKLRDLANGHDRTRITLQETT